MIILGLIMLSGIALFKNPMSPDSIDGWKVPPSTFAGQVYQIECTDKGCSAPRPWVGDESWHEYRIEIEILPEENFAGIDFNVQNDGWGGANVHFFASDNYIQMGGVWGSVVGWKLLPVFPASRAFTVNEWVKIRIDVGEKVANLYIDNELHPTATFHDLPFSNGGIRPWAYVGKACFRNLRITALEPGSVKPIVENPWAKLNHPNVIRQWQVSGPFSAGFDPMAKAILSKEQKWITADTDSMGVLNLTALFPHDNTSNVAFAKAFLSSKKPVLQKVFITYTDRFSLWCNGKLIFEGKPRGWFDPDREKLGNSRLIFDQFEVELPLELGENTILVRSESTEPYGWGFWIRTDTLKP